MLSNWFGRLILVLTAIVVPETFLNAAQPCCGRTPVDGSLAGQLLIASPTIRDPHFDHAVILVVRPGHCDQYANRGTPFGERSGNAR
jgi:hypothetical protein